MRRLINIVLLSLVVASAYALDVECVGVATQVIDGHDTLFIFRDEIHMRSKVGDVDWYNGDGTIYASNIDEVYPDAGCYRVNGCRFCVELYKGIDDLDFTIEPTCDNTILHLTGDIYSRAHTYSLSYNALAWNTEAWVDSAAEMSGDLGSYILMPALYGATPIRLCYDSDLRHALGLDSACVEVDFPADSVIAVKHEITSLATTRGEEGERSNERNRNDKDIRYVFNEPGTYRVVCSVNNNQCTSDSTEVAVAVAESYLAVPNVFTPNGDGKNDEFRVSYRSLREFHCWVYNRWGKLVYEWDDPAKGWDGTINGRPAAEGAYFYVIRALGTDAAKNASYIGLKAVYKKMKLNADKAALGVYQLSGDINLLR